MRLERDCVEVPFGFKFAGFGVLDCFLPVVLILVTDEQSHQALSGPKGKGYCINVGTYQNGIGYGTWTHIDGWSEAVLTYISESERVG